MLIFDREPLDWSDLQDLVAQLFREVGCQVEVDKQIALARGEKAVDVWVRDGATVPPLTMLVECKLWKRSVPQEVVHSFRTVVADAGAHRGFIVSRGGFQSGAYEAVTLTSVDLVTFENLQEMFFERWNVAMANRFMPYADRLFPYWDPSGGRMPRIPWNDSHRQRHRELVEAYRPLIRLGPGLKASGFKWPLPMTIPRAHPHDSGESHLVLQTHRQLYDFIDMHKHAALADFQLLHGETPVAEPTDLDGHRGRKER